MNQISRTIEYALLKADELTPAEIGTATGYAANEVQAGLKALVEAKLAHKAGKAGVTLATNPFAGLMK